MSGGDQSWIGTAVGIGIALLMLGLRWRRINRSRPLHVGRLWIVPALYLLVVASAFTAFPPHGWGWFANAAALLAGSGAGWWRGTAMRIELDPDTGVLQHAQTPAALVFVVLLVLLRWGMRAIAGPHSLIAMHAHLVTGLLMSFALGMLALQRLEMFVRARRLLTGR